MVETYLRQRKKKIEEELKEVVYWKYIRALKKELKYVNACIKEVSMENKKIPKRLDKDKYIW